MELTRIYSSRGPDGLSRADRERMSNYRRKEFLFEKFLYSRKKNQTLQLTHEHILDIGDKTLKKVELSIKNSSKSENESFLKNEVDRLEKEVEQFKTEIYENFRSEFENQKKSMKEEYEKLMIRIEKMRDDSEEERMKELVKKLNEECEHALRKQWEDAEEIKRRTLQIMIEQTRKQVYEEERADKERCIKLALEKAEEEFKVREQEAMKRTRDQCELESSEKIKNLCQRYDASIEAILRKLKDTEEKLKKETEVRCKVENDFRLLQADYKRFMNYTDHFNSDYMMKLRHVGNNLLEDPEYESKLDATLENLTKLKIKSYKKLANIENKNQ
ncbi:stress response nst1-like [Brachionus plicatilis]|uniref:Stress response nst1-like n=1 Tax=Brachionus plicatilis TaxID=10195 RepID=A0A3M7RX17_BRAPC|nr:stress response nst1-like [Brachionus plicatilis]